MDVNQLDFRLWKVRVNQEKVNLGHYAQRLLEDLLKEVKLNMV
jgi:hypothetical protein